MRHINDRFVQDLLNGELSYFLKQVKDHPQSLSLEIRKGYINIYYKGGSLLKIKQKRKGYTFRFDAKYCKNKDNDRNFDLLSSLPTDDAKAYETHLSLMMEEMDSWFLAHPKPERDFQHRLLVNNPEIVDIEYQVGRRMRLDMLLYSHGKLIIVENKYGTGAISGKAGLSEHYKDICTVLQDPHLLQEMLDSVCHISRAKNALGLRDMLIEQNDIKRVEILFLLANYDSKSKTLDNELTMMNNEIPVNIMFVPGDHTKIDFK